MYTPKGDINDALYKAMQDETFIAKLGEAKSPEDCYEVAKAAGMEMPMEEFQKSMEVMKAYLDEKEEGILSEEDLDSVAGGKMNSKDAADVAISTISAAAGIAGAAASAAGV
ncbi:MAG: hypothetical protein ACOYBE_05435 [Blautia sp.]|jgi:hypothetical protein